MRFVLVAGLVTAGLAALLKNRFYRSIVERIAER